MSDFDEYDDNYRARRRARPDSPRANSRPPREASAADRRRPDDEDADWRTDDVPPRRPAQRSTREPRDEPERWPDAEDDNDADRRPDDAARRDSLMRRRLRVARREEPDAEYDDDSDDFEPARPARRYARPDVAYTPRYQSGGCGGALLYLALGGIAIFVLLLLVGRQMLGSVTSNVPAQIRQIVATPTTTVFDRGGTIKQIQSLNRLETSSFSVERVIEANVQRGNILDSILGERLLLIASGNVVAGVDMSKLREGDVDISADGKRITLTLPPSAIFSSALDNQRTRVYDRQTRIGTQITGSENKDLETQARQEAEHVILQAACEGGIMQKAADEAQHSMEQFLRLLKFQEVHVISQAGACVAPGPTNAPTPAP
ncbi:MAG: DUF4230 domain-containing protein [Roseiflexaceae bacterium]